MTATTTSGATTYEAVIGLEVHAELSTRTKMFCSCANEFGAEPNTNVCPVCLGLPGSLPVTNRQAVDFALRFGAAVGSEIGRAIFHRKNYFYPDMPKDFQISQYDEPICRGGQIVTVAEDSSEQVVRLHRAHLEEDTGKSRHIGGDGRIHGADHSLIDYNRAGVPLLEIVSEPDIRTPEGARDYVNELRAVLGVLGISDVKMEEGSLRVDANVSLRPAGAGAFGTKVEVKNMNSVRSVQRALAYEIERQAEVLTGGGAILQETRHWDEGDLKTHGMRSKEEAFDYRYFPEPDLVPIEPSAEWVADAAAGVPDELPAQRVVSLSDEWAADPDLVKAIVYTPGLGDFVAAEIAAGADATASVNWASQQLLALLNETGSDFASLGLAAGTFAELSDLVTAGTLSKKLAREVLAETIATGKAPAAVVADKGLEQISDSGELEKLVADVIAANPDAVEKFRSGNDKILGFLVGQIMKQSQGKANPGTVNELLRKVLG